MFDFEKLKVYNKSKELNKNILLFLDKNSKIDIFLRDQLKRASISIVINLAEGCGRFTKADKRNFYIISRGSLNEVIAIVGIIKDMEMIKDQDYINIYNRGTEIGKMLMGLINAYK